MSLEELALAYGAAVVAVWFLVLIWAWWGGGLGAKRLPRWFSQNTE